MSSFTICSLRSRFPFFPLAAHYSIYMECVEQLHILLLTMVKMTSQTATILLLLVQQVMSCNKAPHQPATLTTLPHPRNVAVTPSPDQETTASSTTASTTSTSTTTTTTTTAAPLVVEVARVTRRSEEVVLQWTNGVNMTLELTELPGTRCSYRGGAMPWDAASSVTVAGCPEAESFRLAVASAVYGDLDLEVDTTTGLVRGRGGHTAGRRGKSLLISGEKTEDSDQDGGSLKIILDEIFIHPGSE